MSAHSVCRDVQCHRISSGDHGHSKSNSQVLKTQMDRYWNSHFWWTKIVITSAVKADPCLASNLEYLYENQSDIGGNFGRLVHSKKAAKELTAALKVHITIAVEIVVAAIAGDQPLVEELYRKWQTNASEIARIYARWGSKISYKRMNKLMQEHLATTLAEAVAIIGGDCENANEKVEVALAHIWMMSDYLMRRL